MPYQKHVFVCTNIRKDGSRPSCGARGEEVRKYLKKVVKEESILSCRINSAGCMNVCEEGPALVVYPQNIWYRVENEHDANAVLQHLKTGEIATEILLPEIKE